MLSKMKTINKTGFQQFLLSSEISYRDGALRPLVSTFIILAQTGGRVCFILQKQLAN